MWIWKSTQQHAVHHGEDGSIRANSERKREYRDGRKHWRLGQNTYAITKVLQKSLQRRAGPHVACRFLHQCDVAEFANGCVPCLMQITRMPGMFSGSHIEMALNLFVQFVVF